MLFRCPYLVWYTSKALQGYGTQLMIRRQVGMSPIGEHACRERFFRYTSLESTNFSLSTGYGTSCALYFERCSPCASFDMLFAWRDSTHISEHDSARTVPIVYTHWELN